MLILFFIIALMGAVQGAASSSSSSDSWGAVPWESPSYKVPQELHFLIEDARAGMQGAQEQLFDRIYQGLVPTEVIDGKFLLKLLKGKPIAQWSRAESFAVAMHVPLEHIPVAELGESLRQLSESGNFDALAIRGILLSKQGEEELSLKFLNLSHLKGSIIASYFLSTVATTEPGANGLINPTVISFFRQASMGRKDVQVQFGRHHLTPRITGQVVYQEAMRHIREAASRGCYLGYYELAQNSDPIDSIFYYTQAAQNGHIQSKNALETWIKIKPQLDLYTTKLSEKKQHEIESLMKSFQEIEKLSSKAYKIGGYAFPSLIDLGASVSWYLHFLNRLTDSTLLLNCLDCSDKELKERLCQDIKGNCYMSLNHMDAEKFAHVPSFECLRQLQSQLVDLNQLVTALYEESESKRPSMIKGLQTAFSFTQHYLKPWVDALASTSNQELFLQRTQSFLKVTSKEMAAHLEFIKTAEARFFQIIKKTAPYRNERFRQAVWR